MKELKKKVKKLREFMFRRDFIKLTESELKEKEIVLKKEAHEAMKAHPNKQEAFRIWTNEFTGRYDG